MKWFVKWKFSCAKIGVPAYNKHGEFKDHKKFWYELYQVVWSTEPIVDLELQFDIRSFHVSHLHAVILDNTTYPPIQRFRYIPEPRDILTPQPYGWLRTVRNLSVVINCKHGNISTNPMSVQYTQHLESISKWVSMFPYLLSLTIRSPERSKKYHLDLIESVSTKVILENIGNLLGLDRDSMKSSYFSVVCSYTSWTNFMYSIDLSMLPIDLLKIVHAYISLQ